MAKTPELKKDSAKQGYYKVIYPNIQKWMLENGWTYYRMAKKTGYSDPGIRAVLQGLRNPTKPLIDALLTLTGMSYEEAFQEGG